MTFATLLVAMLSTQTPDPNSVLLVSYQGAGRSQQLTQGLLESCSNALTPKGFHPKPLSESERQLRAATMCGEDGECLATLGRRSESAWVVGLGVGVVGKNTIVSALLVDVDSGKVTQRLTKTVPSAKLNPTTLGPELISTLFAGMTPRAPLTPPPVPVVEKPVVLAPTHVPAVPVEVATRAPEHRLRPAAIGVTIGAVVLAGVGTGLTIAAQQHHQGLATTAAAQRAEADAMQRGLNLGADVTVGVAIAAAATAVVLFVVDAVQAGPHPKAVAP